MKRNSPPDPPSPLQPISLDVLREKYLKPGESSVEDLYSRVARALASVEAPALREKYEALFLANLHAGAIGAGRIMSAAGTDIQATLINCFVQPVGDCIQGVDEEGYPAFTKPCAKRPKPCGAVAAWAMTSRASARAALKSKAPIPWRRGRAATSMCSTSPAPRSKRGLAPWRADGRAAHRPPRCEGVHHRQAHARPLEQLQRVGGRVGCVHRSRSGRWPVGAGAPRAAGRALQAGAHQRADGFVGVRHRACARVVGHDHEIGLRLCRARHFVPGRINAGTTTSTTAKTSPPPTLWRTAAAVVRLLRPGAHHPDALCAQRFRAGRCRSV